MGNQRVAILGAGSFGTALASVLGAKGLEVRIWAREREIVDGINANHINPIYLTDLPLSESILAFHEPAEALRGAEVVLFAIPTHAIRSAATAVKELLTGQEIIVTVAKGIEGDTLLTPSRILSEVLHPITPKKNIGVLTGPSHAEEVGFGKPTAIVACGYSVETAEVIQDTFLTPMLRVYLNEDIVGAEIGGALKNIMAIAAGIVDGAELGDNAKAALMTRGLHEMKRMGLEMGARSETFSGLTGMGDLIVTCTSRHSRNRFVGYHIGQGKTLEEIMGEMTMVAEGVKTTASVAQWAARQGVDMPITMAVHHVLFEGADPQDILYDLMTRDPKNEITV